jgi:hypothetical protein
MSEGDPAVGLGQAMGDIVLLKMKNREMVQALKDNVRLQARITEMEVAFAFQEKHLQAAITALEKHGCYPSCDGSVEAALVILKPPPPPKPIYTAIFLDDASKEALLKAFPPMHPKVFGHHVTLVFKPGPDAIKAFEPCLGKEVEFEVVGASSDDKGQAAKVALPAPYPELSPGQLHHVTISCVSSPVYSNELLAKGWKDVPPLRLKGTVRHFTK